MAKRRRFTAEFKAELVLEVLSGGSCQADAHRGPPWENGYAERLIRPLKEEEVHINDYQNITEARDRIGHFITQVSNQKRPHSALGYLTPIEFQRKTLS